MNQSPAPWKVGGHPGDDSGTGWRTILAKCPFGDMYVAQALETDAKMIVRAVNCHEDLVAALEGLFEHCAMIHKHWGEGCNQKEANEAKERALAAIAKAKEAS